MNKLSPSGLRIFFLFLRVRGLRFYNRAATGLDKSMPARFQSNYAWVIFFASVLLVSAFAFHRENLNALRIAQNPLPAIIAYLSTTWAAALFLTLGTSDFKKTEWDLEWLVCLPISKTKLMIMRILERSLSNPFSVFAVLPPAIWLLYFSGHSVAFSFGVGVLLAYPLMLLSSAVQTLMDTGARVHLKPARIKNLQAATNVMGALLFYLAALPRSHPPFSFLHFLPTGLLVQAIIEAQLQLRYLAAYLLSSFLLTALVAVALVRTLRRGVVSGSGQSQGVRRIQSETSREGARFFSPVTLREMRLLGRDHQYLAQTVLAPVALLSMQVYVLFQSKGELFREPRAGAALAMGLGAYSMMSSGFLSLVNEGQALWILFTLPQSIGSLLWQRARLWISFVYVYEIAFFLYCANLSHFQRLGSLFVSFALIFILVPLMMLIATALGVLGFDGVAQAQSKRMKPSSTYLYLACLAASVACVYSADLYTSFTLLLLMGCAATALWQKALVRIPILYDPSHWPKPKLDLGDLLFGVLGYYLIFQVCFLIELNQDRIASHPVYWLAQGLALSVTGLGLWFRGGKRRGLSFRFRFATLDGVRLLVSIFGLLGFAHFYPRVLPTPVASTAVLLALPLLSFGFEVFFRGLLFAELRLRFSFLSAGLIASFLFAIVFPPALMPLYFLLGIFSSYLFERTRSLLPSVILHLSLSLFFIFL